MFCNIIGNQTKKFNEANGNNAIEVERQGIARRRSAPITEFPDDLKFGYIINPLL